MCCLLLCNHVHCCQTWCRENFVNQRNMKLVSEVRSQLQDICIGLSMPLDSSDVNDTSSIRYTDTSQWFCYICCLYCYHYLLQHLFFVCLECMVKNNYIFAWFSQCSLCKYFVAPIYIIHVYIPHVCVKHCSRKQKKRIPVWILSRDVSLSKRRHTELTRCGSLA